MSTDQLCMANIAYSVLVPEDGFDKGLIVYKYRQLNDWTLKGLVMSQAYLAPPAAFNDPFERKTFNDLNVDTSGFDREAAVKTINHLFTDCGIFCLCARADDLHMWSFYGVDEKNCGLGGFAIGYRLESLLVNLKPCVLGEDEIVPRWKYVYRVKYGNKPPKISAKKIITGRSHLVRGKEFLKIFAHKASAFKAEDEVRIVVEQRVGKIHVGHGLYDHSPEDIVEIVFGEHFSAENEAAVRRILEGREIHFRRAKRIPNQYGLQLVEA